MDRTIDEFAAAVGTVDAVTVEGAATRGGALPGYRQSMPRPGSFGSMRQRWCLNAGPEHQ